MNLNTRRPLRQSEKYYSLAVIVIPMIMTIVAIATLFYTPLLAGSIWLFVIFYSYSVLGISVGYHRMLTHRSFIARRWVKLFFVIGGCFAYQGPPLFWVSSHRRHHRFGDENGDPHSPHTEHGWWKNLVHSHIGWMLNHELEDWEYYSSDLLKDRDILFINKYYIFFALSGIILPGIINALIYHNFASFWQGILFAGFVRTFVVHHITWSINSITHLFGYESYKTTDKSKNNVIFGVIGYGEGWHNNHHAFPSSAKLGLQWWEVDIGYYCIKFLAVLGLISKVKKPTYQQRKNKKNMIRQTET